MQYNYKEWAGDPAGPSFEFYVAYPHRIFVGDLFSALKTIAPLIVGAGIPLEDYETHTLNAYLFHCGINYNETGYYESYYYCDLYIDIDTSSGQFVLSKNDHKETMDLRVNGDEQLFGKIAGLLAADINFNKIMETVCHE